VSFIALGASNEDGQGTCWLQYSICFFSIDSVRWLVFSWIFLFKWFRKETARPWKRWGILGKDKMDWQIFGLPFTIVIHSSATFCNWSSFDRRYQVEPIQARKRHCNQGGKKKNHHPQSQKMILLYGKIFAVMDSTYLLKSIPFFVVGNPSYVTVQQLYVICKKHCIKKKKKFLLFFLLLWF